ncbi:unnamed protein product [Amoebophrya sp. A120]|nr:unnamed protein product [Amoebophrya sp. A120]|eukprot:GSA120T00009336001.1
MSSTAQESSSSSSFWPVKGFFPQNLLRRRGHHRQENLPVSKITGLPPPAAKKRIDASTGKVSSTTSPTDALGTDVDIASNNEISITADLGPDFNCHRPGLRNLALAYIVDTFTFDGDTAAFRAGNGEDIWHLLVTEFSIRKLVFIHAVCELVFVLTFGLLLFLSYHLMGVLDADYKGSSGRGAGSSSSTDDTEFKDFILLSLSACGIGTELIFGYSRGSRVLSVLEALLLVVENWSHWIMLTISGALIIARALTPLQQVVFSHACVISDGKLKDHVGPLDLGLDENGFEKRQILQPDNQPEVNIVDRDGPLSRSSSQGGVGSAVVDTVSTPVVRPQEPQLQPGRTVVEAADHPGDAAGAGAAVPPRPKKLYYTDGDFEEFPELVIRMSTMRSSTLLIQPKIVIQMTTRNGVWRNLNIPVSDYAMWNPSNVLTIRHRIDEMSPLHEKNFGFEQLAFIQVSLTATDKSGLPVAEAQQYVRPFRVPEKRFVTKRNLKILENEIEDLERTSSSTASGVLVDDVAHDKEKETTSKVDEDGTSSKGASGGDEVVASKLTHLKRQLSYQKEQHKYWCFPDDTYRVPQVFFHAKFKNMLNIKNDGERPWVPTRVVANMNNFETVVVADVTESGFLTKRGKLLRQSSTFQ